MIHSINFMGREECLTKPAKKIVDKTHEYLRPDSIIEKDAATIINESKKVVEEQAAKLKDVVETQKTSLTEAVKANHAPYIVKNPNKSVAESNLEMANSWARSHGNPV